MSYPSEYSLKSVQGASSHRYGGSSGIRFMALLRSLFRPVSEKYPDVSGPPRSSHSRAASISLRRRKTEPPVQSSSDYEYLPEVRDQNATNYSNMTLSGTQFDGKAIRPSLPAIPPRTCSQRQYYTPQIKRANTDNFCAHSSGLNDIWIVNLDPKPPRMIRTTSQYRPGDKFLNRKESRPIYSESVEVSISNALPHLQIQQPPLLQQSHQQKCKPPLPVPRRPEKKVVSTANIPLDCQHANSQLHIPNASENRLDFITQDLDRSDRKVELSAEVELRRQSKIKEKILAEWEQSWRRGEKALDGSFSSLGTREEPSMVGWYRTHIFTIGQARLDGRARFHFIG